MDPFRDSFNRYSQQSGTSPGRPIYSLMHYLRVGERNSQESGIVGTKGNLAPELVVIIQIFNCADMEEIHLWKEAQTKDPAIQATLQQLRK